MKGYALCLLLLARALPAASGAPLLCTPAASPSLLRAEGLAEPVGDIVLSCTGAPGPVTMSLGVLLSVPVTNRVAADGAIDVAVTVDTPSGPLSAGAGASLSGISSVSLGGIHFTVPESGAVMLRISNLRAAVAQQGISNTTPIQALLTVGGNVLLTATTLTVGIPQRSLLSTGNSSTVNCYGSPAPSGAITMGSLFSAGSRAASTRVTEGFADAFDKRRPGADSGVRIVVRYSGFPEGARIFVPDAIAGSDAVQPTSGGDLPTTASGGVYAPGSGSLLLVRVAGANSSGAGGTLAYTPGAPGSGPAALDGASEIALSGGSGMAVYEVVDANPLVRESADIPTFFALPPAGGAVARVGRQSVSLGPVSDVAAATATDPVPRFVEAAPLPDCSVLGDCDVFPKLAVNAPPLAFTAESGGNAMGAYIPVGNTGGGALAWDVRATYENGSDWMRWAVNPVLPYSWGAVALTISPVGLAPGVYKGTLVIDAGLTAGSQSLPVTLTVVPPTMPYVSGITDAATFGKGPFAPGSIVTVWGVKLSGASVSVLFDGIEARRLYSGDSQINLQVPPELAGRASTQMVVTVDGQSTKPRMVDLVPVAPAVFGNGILNQDWSVNSATNAAPAGSIVSIWATGLAAADRSTISVRLGDRDIASLEYAGPAPTLTGVDQVNLRIPAGLAPATADLQLCATNPWTSQRVCSPAVKITTR
jgi:uncharacterized protein (TIGR03437 family)